MTQPYQPPGGTGAGSGCAGLPQIPAQADPYGSSAPQPWTAPPAKIRSTGVAILLTVVTLGIYPLVYFYCVHDEMKRHAGAGLGGGLALLLSVFVGIAMPYLTSSEVGTLYARRGMPKPVSGLTGLWYFPGILLLGIGPIIWFVKTNGALNSYWRSQGVR
jgi:hypothetical protein